MTSQTPIKQILQQQAEFVTYKYTNFIAEPISPNMISPWQDSSKKNRFSNLKDNDVRRLSDFRHNYSKLNSSAYRSIMDIQSNQNQMLNDDNRNQKQFQTQFVLHSMANNNNQNLENLSEIIAKSNKYENRKQKLKKTYTQEDNSQKSKHKWNEWNEEDEPKNDSQKKMFQTLSTLNKKQVNRMNHSSDNNQLKKNSLNNRKKLTTTVIDINQNTDFDATNKVERSRELSQKSNQAINNFYKLNLFQKYQIKNTNKRIKQNRPKKFFNKFYFDFSVFGFKNSKSQEKSITENNYQKNREEQQVARDRHFEYTLDAQKYKNTAKNIIKIRQLPNKLKSKRTQDKKNMETSKRCRHTEQKRRSKTDQNIRKIQNFTEKSGQKAKQSPEDAYNIIHPGSIVVNLNKMLQQQVRPMPTLNKMTQSSVYKKLRKTLCF